MLQKNAEDITA